MLSHSVADVDQRIIEVIDVSSGTSANEASDSDQDSADAGPGSPRVGGISPAKLSAGMARRVCEDLEEAYFPAAAPKQLGQGLTMPCAPSSSSHDNVIVTRASPQYQTLVHPAQFLIITDGTRPALAPRAPEFVGLFEAPASATATAN